jgi:hypothetical protein
MAYRVRWQFVSRSGQLLDSGSMGKGFCAYVDAMAEFLRPYSEVSRCPTESYWLARRSREADLAVWVWIERDEIAEPTGATPAWMSPSEAADQAKTPVRGEPPSIQPHWAVSRYG